MTVVKLIVFERLNTLTVVPCGLYYECFLFGYHRQFETRSLVSFYYL